MHPRRAWTLVALALVVIAVAVVLRAGGDDPAPRPPLPGPGQALDRLPATAEVVALVATDRAAPASAALRELLARVPGSAIAIARARRELGPLEPTLDRLARLGGSPLALAVDAAGRDLVLAWQAGDVRELRTAIADAVARGALRRAAGGVLEPTTPIVGLGAFATDGPLLLAGSTAALVRRALRSRGGPRPRLTLPRREFARAHLRPGAVRLLPLAGVVPDVVAAARAGLLRVVPDENGLRGHLAVRFARGTDLPLRAGGRPAAAPAAFAAPVTVGVRDPAVALPVVLRALGAAEGYEQASRILRLLRRDDLDEVLRDQLTGTATVGVRPGGGTAVQLRLRDAGPLRDLLDDLARVPDLLLGRTGLDVDEDGGVFALRLPDAPPLRAAVEGDRLGLGTAGIDVRAVARRAPAARTTPGAGALAARLKAPDLRRRILERFGLPRLALIPLDALGDLSLGVTASRDRLDATGSLPVGP